MFFFYCCCYFFRFRLMCQSIIAHKLFDYVVLAFIFSNCITVALERPKILQGSLVWPTYRSASRPTALADPASASITLSASSSLSTTLSSFFFLHLSLCLSHGISLCLFFIASFCPSFSLPYSLPESIEIHFMSKFWGHGLERFMTGDTGTGGVKKHHRKGRV